MSSISGLGLRNKAKAAISGGKSSSSSSDSKKQGSSITGLGLRNKAAGLTGHGKDPYQASRDHVAVPRSSLKDPSNFPPPPKNINYHGGAALPNQLTPDRRGLGAPLSAADIESKEQQEWEEEQRRIEEEEEPPAPRVPYRTDTTGLSTTQFAPPVARRDAADGSIVIRPTAPQTKPKPKPGLPPRLPDRQNSNPGPDAPSPPPTYGAAVAEPPAHRGQLNQTSLNRLGAAGVSVPGLGIGGHSSPGYAVQQPPAPSRTSTASPSSYASQNSSPTVSKAPSSGNPQLSELQNRFARMGTSSPKPEVPTQGTTWAEKQAALRTASSFRDDPSSISASDARNAASTANNFRERHSDQVSAGWKSANTVNQKYGLSDKVASYGASAQKDYQSAEEPESPGIEMRDNTILPVKKAPPPRPKKRAELSGNPGAGNRPPPIPLSSKPK